MSVPTGRRAHQAPGVTARGLAVRALVAIDQDGARANVLLPTLLAPSGLDDRDRAFVTELVYGSVRMQRACDWLVDRHLRRPVEPAVRAALRLGAYQMAMLGTPRHAAVSATVAEVHGPARGLVNAVLRRVADAVDAGVAWPSLAVELSYPDWIVDELTTALGEDDAVAALRQMNVAALVTTRADGYVQDRASQWVAKALAAAGAPMGGAGAGGGEAGADGATRAGGGVARVAGERILDLCAAPGGKATWLAGGGRAAGGPGLVVAGDVAASRLATVVANVGRLRLDNVVGIALDGTRPPFPPATFDRVLVDAPCSGLGVLRRRPDARWRARPDDVARLAALQRQLIEQALELVRPGGVVVYSVCTLTAAETLDIDAWLAGAHPEAEAIPAGTLVGPEWEPLGRGARLLPQRAGTDGMYLLALRHAPAAAAG
ncbi:MAG TPA: transcription antitermination factor NusB [Acidimicrobiales bacterium]|nr:transcription antitermination factor NusB [Acidimicrobiales bacterium]